MSFRHWHQVLPLNATLDKRIIIVGDLHGCSFEFNALLDKVEFDEKKDVVVLVGDLVNKGPDSKGCVSKAQAIGAYAVIGNHDYNYAVVGAEKLPHRAQLVEEIGPSGISWLRSLPSTLFLEEYNTIVVHAGLDPSLTRIEDNKGSDMMTM